MKNHQIRFKFLRHLRFISTFVGSICGIFLIIDGIFIWIAPDARGGAIYCVIQLSATFSFLFLILTRKLVIYTGK